MRHVSFGQTKRSMLDHIIAAVRLRKVKGLIGNSGKILDLGCGYNGELLSSLGSKFVGYGVDLSVNPKIKNLRKGRVDQRLPFDDESFDVVTALAIIEHVENPGKMLSEICRVLKPGGKVFITTPAMGGKGILELMARLGVISKAEIDDHKRYYTKDTLRIAINDSGLKNAMVKHFGIMWLNLLAEATK